MLGQPLPDFWVASTGGQHLQEIRFPFEKVRGIARGRPRSRGALALQWRGAKVPGHPQEVLNFVKAL